MENKMNYPKAIVLLLSGILALAASFWLGQESGAYGFLMGYGYAALTGGFLAIVYLFLKQPKANKKKTAS